MKSILVGLILVVASWSASAGDLQGAGSLHQTHSLQSPPLCLAGQTRVPIYDSKGNIIGYMCVGSPGPMTPHW